MAAAYSQPATAADGDAVAAALKAQLESTAATRQRPADIAALEAFYAGRDWRPVWVDEKGAVRAGRLVAEELRRAGDWGLSESEFGLTAFSAPMPYGRWSSEQTAAADIELSLGVLEYAHQARGGRIPEPARQLSSYLDRRPKLIDPAFVLVMVPTSPAPDAVLRSLHPQHDQFRKLQVAYRNLRTKAADSAAAEMPAQGALLVPGMRHADVQPLRARLNVPAATADAELYDETLSAAVKLFQKSSGISGDGLVGNRTRKALGQSFTSQLAVLRANMEQWRWMPETLGGTHLFVNIPEFKIRLFDGQAVAYEERVIVGKGDTQTPVFSKALSTVVLRPTWKLPDSIKLEKLLHAKRNGRSLEDQGYVIKKGRKTVDSEDVDWSSADLSHYEIYQPSGDGNALGDVKFLFPNKHSVYLHDTPMKSLFNADARLFSHGCVRLRNPLTMAQTLLDRDRGDGAFDVKDLVNDGPEVNEIALERPVPIHIAYFTAWADDDATVRTFGDPYGHEERIRQALDGKWSDIDKGDDHLAAVDTWQLKEVRVEQQPQRPAPRRYTPPMGVTRVPSAPASGPKMVTAPAGKKWKSRGDGGVGEIMRNALMNN